MALSSRHLALLLVFSTFCLLPGCDSVYVAIKCGGRTLPDPTVPRPYTNVSYGEPYFYKGNISTTSVAGGLIFFRQDAYYAGHNTTVTDYGFIPINGTTDPVLYRTDRVGRTILYTLNLPQGAYTANLYFAETDPLYYANGTRTFDISIQGNVVAPKFDIFKAAGAATAVILQYPTTVDSRGLLQISLESTTYNALAKINAIYVYPTGQPRPPVGSYSAGNDTLLLNVGGTTPLVTPDRGAFQSDQFYTGGAVQTYNIPFKNVGPEYAALFTTARTGKSFGYIINVKTAGDYVIDMFFAEPNANILAGERLINVYINGVEVLNFLDLFRAAITPLRAVTVSKAANAPNKQLRIDFFAVTGQVVLFGLGVRPLNATTKANFALDCGSPADTLGQEGLIFTKDNGAIAKIVPAPGGGNTTTLAPPQVDSSLQIYKQPVDLPRLVNDLLYLSIRSGSFDYQIPLPNGDYVVNLHFAELGRGVKGARIFNVLLQGISALADFDVYDATFNNVTAIIKQFPATVRNGVLTVSFRPGPQGDPFISALSVHPDLDGHVSTSFRFGNDNDTAFTRAVSYPVLPPTVTSASLPCPAVAGPPRALNCSAGCPAYAPPGSVAVNTGSPTGYNSSCGVRFLADQQPCNAGDVLPPGAPYCRTNIRGPTFGFAFQDNLNNVTGTTDPVPYLSERIGFNTYKFPCTPGKSYVVTSYYAEISGFEPNIDVQAPRQREFAMVFNGASCCDQSSLGPIDPFAAAGNRKFVAAPPFAKVVPCPAGGVLSAQLVPTGLRDAPAIKAIWVYEGNTLPGGNATTTS